MSKTKLFTNIILSLSLALFISACGDSGGDSGLNSEVEVGISNIPLVIDSPKPIINPLDPTEIIQATPNWFQATFGIINSSEYDVVLVSIKYEVSYSNNNGQLKKVEAATVPALEEDYLAIVPSGDNASLDNIIVYDLGDDNPDLNYTILATFKGWFAETGQASQPLERFTKQLTFIAN